MGSGNWAFVRQSEEQVASDPGPAMQSAVSVDSSPYVLTGVVINASTGEPVPRALVQLYAGRQRSVFTGQDGRFEFKGLPQMQVSLSVRKPGFFNEQELDQEWSLQKPVEIGPNAPPVLLKLSPEAVITGRVHNASGEPLEGVAIRAEDFRVVNGRKQWQQRGGASTNENGEFRIANLVPGSYYVAAGPSWNRNRIEDGNPPGDQAYPEVYYPAAAERSGAAPVHLAPGRHAQIEFTLKPASTFVISGVVTGYPPEQGVNLQLLDRSGNDPSLGMQFDSQTGKFHARVASTGPCIIKAHAQGAPGQTLYAETTVTVSADVTGIHLDLTPALSIPIAVRMEQTKEPSAYDPLSTPAALNVPVSVGVAAAESQVSRVADVGEDPKNPALALRNVEAGKYRVEVSSNNGLWYVHSSTYGDTDLLREQLTVLPGQSQPIEIVLRDDSATLAINLRGSGNERQTRVLIVPERAPLNPRVVITHGDGELQLPNLAPGEYRVFAFDRIDGLEYANPEALREYAARAASVTLQPDQTVTVKVDMIHRGE